MPAFRCCGTRVGDKFDFINFDLPDEFRSNNDFSAKDCVDVSYEHFVEYKMQLLVHPDLSELTEKDLQRAVEFFPCDFTPPLRKSDFAITIENKLVVSQRVLAAGSESEPYRPKPMALGSMTGSSSSGTARAIQHSNGICMCIEDERQARLPAVPGNHTHGAFRAARQKSPLSSTHFISDLDQSCQSGR